MTRTISESSSSKAKTTWRRRSKRLLLLASPSVRSAPTKRRGSRFARRTSCGTRTPSTSPPPTRCELHRSPSRRARSTTPRKRQKRTVSPRAHCAAPKRPSALMSEKTALPTKRVSGLGNGIFPPKRRTSAPDRLQDARSRVEDAQGEGNEHLVHKLRTPLCQGFDILLFLRTFSRCSFFPL